jgi:DNA ligase-1
MNGSEAAKALLLAHPWDPAKVDPTGWWVSEKLDGVRAYWDGVGGLWSRLGKRFEKAPDRFLAGLPRGTPLDGELYLGRKMFNDTIRAIKGSAGWDKVQYRVFDAPGFENMAVEGRWAAARLVYGGVVDQTQCKDPAHLGVMLRAVESLGGEGLMLRAPGSLYERRRSRTLLKVKSFFDVEGVVMVQIAGKGKHAGRMGALTCLLASGAVVDVGTGFTDAERENPPKIGATITIRYQELTPAGVPRFPVFVSERNYE